VLVVPTSWLSPRAVAVLLFVVPSAVLRGSLFSGPAVTVRLSFPLPRDVDALPSVAWSAVARPRLLSTLNLAPRGAHEKRKRNQTPSMDHGRSSRKRKRLLRFVSPFNVQNDFYRNWEKRMDINYQYE